MTLPAKNAFNPQFPISDSSGNPTQQFRDYMRQLDLLVAALAAGVAPTLVNAANDAAAKAAGVAVGSLYRNGTVIHQRIV